MADLSSLSDQQLEQYRQSLTQAKPEVHSSFGVVGDTLAGVGGSFAQHAVGVYDLLRKIPGADKVLPDSKKLHEAIADATPDNTPSHVGRFLETAGEYLYPAGKAAELTQGAGLVTRMAAQGAAAGGVRAAQGGNTGEVADTAALGALGPAAGEVAGILTPKLTAMAEKAGSAVRGAAADIVGLKYPKIANAMRAIGKVAEKVNETPGAAPVSAPAGASPATVAPQATAPATTAALTTPQQRSAAQALADEMLKHGSATQDMIVTADGVPAVKTAAAKAAETANGMETTARAAKSQNLATMLHDEGLPSKTIANWDLKTLNAAARDRGMKTPFSMKSFGELVQQLRQMESTK